MTQGSEEKSEKKVRRKQTRAVEVRGKELCILRKAWILSDFIQQGWGGRKMSGEKRRERCKEMWEKYERLLTAYEED